MAPTPGKIFRIVDTATLEEIRDKLIDFRVTEMVEEIGILVKDIEEVYIVGDDSYALAMYRFDELYQFPHRSGETQYVITTKDVPIYFFEHEGYMFFTCLIGKKYANQVAVELGSVLNMSVLEARISSAEVLGKFTAAQSDAKLAFFDNMDLINLEKAALYGGEGGDVAQTTLWGDYLEHGLPWYTMYESKVHGYTVGLVRDGSLTIFSKVDTDEFKDYVLDEIMPLVLKRRPV